MPNQSQVELLVLSGFNGLNQLRYLYFCITCAGYLLIILFNVSILTLICVKQNLHQSMYIFLANLLLNTLIGCAAFYPKLLHDLLSDVQLISRTGCLLQAFFVHTYVCVECNILTVMAFDRYAAIAHPLTYHSLVSSSRVHGLLAAAWILPVAAHTCLLSLSSLLPLCGFYVSRTFCDNRSITYLSCVDISLISLLELVFVSAGVFLPVLVIFGCYIKILAVSFQVSKSGRANKALSTCVPHLVTYASFVTSIVFEVVQPALAAKNFPHEFRVVMSMEGFLLPPVLNPLIYGLKLPDIRNNIGRMFKSAAARHCA
ncbi:olfactory receptor 6N1-like [Toxotes jaculatrix]|uniref:olfactory receptor 6N1-like n=1 Tax=Toxotes jaculatrix TaxID=941984 RepID=UPI001B3AE4F9|nr:olfactory receptor 6N1-like [Toxotes jaculatrix]